MNKWTRWEDWVAVVVGLVAAVAALLIPPMGASMPWMLIVGILLIVAGVMNLAMPGMVAMEYVQLALGAVLFVAPWLGGYADMGSTAAWICWIGGAVAVIVAALAVRPAMHMHDRSLPH
ncbi:SPW repeat protein [Microbacterium yannicii]|uniref:SPW repeat protein n=1 Tax=Microbacterium yannicii TaxID=671622 RepID=A0ABP9M2I2_9MICO|nr:SPW repeat protein [Microbacterium yannicii]MCO5954927.1 SPW repeat protein [Microbacterium yannicii]